jgi:hypothetical protein
LGLRRLTPSAAQLDEPSSPEADSMLMPPAAAAA